MTRVQTMLTRSQSVTDQLRSLILQGDYLPGTHLQEMQLAEAMDVSRTPVRAALAALGREGLLSYVAKRGYEVRRFGADEIRDMYQVRSVLEGNAAGLCARRGLDGDTAEVLRRLVDQGDEILSGGRLDADDLPAYRNMNGEFHSTLISASGSLVTAAHVTQIRQIPFLSDRIILWEDFNLIHRSHDDHHRVLHAILANDQQRAEAIMREHVYFMGEVVIDFLSKSSAAPPLLQEIQA